MYFLVENNDSLEKYKTIWDKFRADVIKKFDSEPVHNKNFSKTKIESYGDEWKEKWKLFSTSVFNYIDKKLITHIIEDPEISSDESDEE